MEFLRESPAQQMQGLKNASQAQIYTQLQLLGPESVIKFSLNLRFLNVGERFSTHEFKAPLPNASTPIKDDNKHKFAEKSLVCCSSVFPLSR